MYVNCEIEKLMQIFYFFLCIPEKRTLKQQVKPKTCEVFTTCFFKHKFSISRDNSRVEQSKSYILCLFPNTFLETVTN